MGFGTTVLAFAQPIITPFSEASIGPELAAIDTGLVNQALTQNLAYYYPFTIADPFTVSQFFWSNGATVNGNSDAAVYDETGTTKLASTGSTANSGASTLQVTNITDVVLPGDRRYWLAFATDSATHTILWANGGALIQQHWCGVKQQASAWSSGLPSSATFAAPTALMIPFFGITSRSAV